MSEPNSQQNVKTPQTSGQPSGRNGPGGSRRSQAAALGSAAGIVVVVAALAVGLYVLFRLDSWDGGGADSPERFELDLASLVDVPAELLTFTEERRRGVSLTDPVAIACDTQGNVYVAGDRAIEVLRADGSTRLLDLEQPPTCLAVRSDPQAGGTLVYVGAGGQVSLFDDEGEMVRQWPRPSAKSLLTAIAFGADSVFVADAGQRAVLRCDAEGAVLGTIGQPDADREMPGFVLPSPYFDLVVGPDELLYVVNPGMRRVEAYDFEGRLQAYWGRAGTQVAGFFGCCNPVHLALMPDGRFVTSEKGIPRIKVYSADGELDQVVAAPRQLGIAASALGDARGNQKQRVFDVAVDGQGRVLVLDPHRRQVVWYKPQAPGAESQS